MCASCVQTKLRLEMNMEKMKKQHNTDLEEKEEELEDMRTRTQKKVCGGVFFLAVSGCMPQTTLREVK